MQRKCGRGGLPSVKTQEVERMLENGTTDPTILSGYSGLSVNYCQEIIGKWRRKNHLPPLPEGRHRVADKCRHCMYRKETAKGGFSFCDYLSMEGHRRGCPGGEECTAYVHGNPKRGS